MSRLTLSRRRFLTLGTAATGLVLTGCDQLSEDGSARDVLSGAERLSQGVQRLLIGRHALAREFSEADISPSFKANGTTQPGTDLYLRHLEKGFADWRLIVDGMVDRPLALSLPDLRALPARTQITRHDCVEGWSAIGEWTGAPLSEVLRRANLRTEARYLVFHCADDLGGNASKGGDLSSGLYYESIDLVDAFHPQTILAYAMNGAPLGVPNGAPLRLRVERQLGYKHAKYLMRIEATDRLDRHGRGKGGFWEDRGYAWYAGI
jgi:DMSO/TMAO reductase YedYZ molybdopterin-dependent catalytic subunit